MGYAPAAAEGEGNAIAREVDLGDVISMIVSRGRPAAPQPNRGMRSQSLSFFVLFPTSKSRAIIGFSAP